MKLAVLTQAALLFSGVLPLTDSPADSENQKHCGGEFEACFPTMEPVNYPVIGTKVSQLVQNLLYAFLGFTKKPVDGGVMLRIRERGKPICCESSHATFSFLISSHSYRSQVDHMQIRQR